MSPSRAAAWFLRTHALGALALLVFLAQLYGAAVLDEPFRLVLMVGLGGAAVLLLRLERSRDPAGFALCLLLLDIGILGAEALLRTDAFTNPWAAEAARRNLPYDRRIPAEVVLDERAAGHPDTTLFVSPNSFYWAPLMVDGTPTQPFGGVANRLTIHCNESGTANRYVGDSFGFNNPSWPARARIAVIGDSFANGACVAPEDGLAAPLRRLGPTVNLARDGFSSLAEMATLREYRPVLKPELVVWFYFEGNDLDDLPDEAAAPILARYLNDPAFTQGLPARREAVDAALSRYVDTYLDDLNRRRATPFFGLRNFLRNRLPVLLSALRPKPPSPEDEAERLRLFHRVMDQALAEQRVHGERMLFVLLPAPDSVPQPPPLRAERRRAVLAAMAERNVPVLDASTVLADWPHERIFVFGLWSHFTAEAHRAVGDAVREKAARLLGAD